MATDLRNSVFRENKILWLALAVGSILLFAGGPDYFSPRSFKSIWDLGHIVFFSIFTHLALLNRSANDTISFSRQYVPLFFIVLLLGVLIEVLQAGSARLSDPADVTRDLIGCLVTLSLWADFEEEIPESRLKGLQMASIIWVAVALFAPVKAMIDEQVAQNQFPVLADFETPLEIDRWTGDSTFCIDHQVYFHGKSSLKVILNTSLYSGVNLKYFPQDWSGCYELQLSIFNPDAASIQLTCRIHDRRHTEGSQDYDDRFNRHYSLAQGWNLIRIRLDEVARAPTQRQLDLRQVRGLAIFATALSRPRVIYLDYVRLLEQRGTSLSEMAVQTPTLR
jgi:VanZ family protein